MDFKQAARAPSTVPTGTSQTHRFLKHETHSAAVSTTISQRGGSRVIWRKPQGKKKTAKWHPKRGEKGWKPSPQAETIPRLPRHQLNTDSWWQTAALQTANPQLKPSCWHWKKKHLKTNNNSLKKKKKEPRRSFCLLFRKYPDKTTEMIRQSL